MYFLMPRKLGKLTFRSKTENGEFADIVEIVSDDYVPINKPEYNGKMKLENLLQGEHIDWFYTDEVWRSIKIENYSTHTGDFMNFRYSLLFHKSPKGFKNGFITNALTKLITNVGIYITLKYVCIV